MKIRRTFKSVISDTLLRQSGLIFVSTLFVNVTNLVFWLVMVRRLAPADYAVLLSLINVMVILSTPASVLQTVITRHVAKYRAHDEKDNIRHLLWHFARWMLLFTGLLIMAMIFQRARLGAFLRVPSVSLINLVAAGIFLSSWSPIMQGALAGLESFNAMAWISMAGGLVKLGLGVLLVWLGWSMAGALWAFVVSFFVIVWFSFWQLPAWLKGRFPSGNPILDLRGVYRSFIPVGLSVFCFYALTSVDVILVNHFFPPQQTGEAGFYSVAQMVGKIVLFIPGAVTIVMFPKVTSAHAQNRDTRPMLRKCIATVGLLCGVAAFFSLLFPRPILGILTGHAQPQAVSLVKYFVIAMSFFALTQILVFYHLSVHRYRYVVVLCAATLTQICGIWLFHGTLIQVLSVLLAVSSVLFLAGLCLVDWRGCDEKSQGPGVCYHPGL